MAKLIAHWSIGDRLYCVDSTFRYWIAQTGDKVAQCPVCFTKTRPVAPLGVSLMISEPVDDYIARLFGER